MYCDHRSPFLVNLTQWPGAGDVPSFGDKVEIHVSTMHWNVTMEFVNIL